MTSSPSVTVAILTFNGEKYIREILQALSTQSYKGKIEILVIDSGSHDATLKIIKSFPEVRLHQIPNVEFGHGKTRNLAAALATGEIIAFLTHDAIPASPHWLRDLVEPFELNPSVVAVLGKQIPRPFAAPITKYEINRVFAQFGSEMGITLFQDKGYPELAHLRDAMTFFSDVNSASRREFLISGISYRDVRYAEDQKFGQDIIAAGYIKGYSARAAVIHSNDLTVQEFGPRTYDEVTGLRQIGVPVPIPSLKLCALSVIQGSHNDFKLILKDRQYSRKRRLYWIAINPWLHLKKWQAIRSAASIDIFDATQVSSGSLESQRKKSNLS